MSGVELWRRRRRRSSAKRHLRKELDFAGGRGEAVKDATGGVESAISTFV